MQRGYVKKNYEYGYLVASFLNGCNPSSKCTPITDMRVEFKIILDRHLDVQGMGGYGL